MHIYYNGEDHVLPSYVCLQPVSNTVGNDARNIWWIECGGGVGWGGGHYLDIENVICNNLIVEIRDIPSPTPSYKCHRIYKCTREITEHDDSHIKVHHALYQHPTKRDEEEVEA